MENSTLQLPKDLIEGIVKTKISAAVCEALVDKTSLLEAAVNKVLLDPTGADGKHSTYSSDRDSHYIHWLMNDMLKKVISETLQEEIIKHKAIIKKNIASQLSRKNSPLLKQLVNAMTGGVVDASQNRYRLTVNIENKSE